ncbi:hypothetical protein BGX26_004740 [Mortierella sp. AD094]|nr:hypothetical protein BGX26_004740 [Mortierella sp. AD094]
MIPLVTSVSFLLLVLATLQLATAAIPWGTVSSQHGLSVCAPDKQPRAPIFSVVEVDQSRCSKDWSKNDFYQHVAVFSSSERRTCAKTAFSLHLLWSSGGVEHQSAYEYTRTNDRYVDETWRFAWLGIDIRQIAPRIVLSTIGIVKGVYLPLLHYSEALTTGKNSLYLFIQFDDKLFTGYSGCGPSNCGVKCDCSPIAHEINMGAIIRNLPNLTSIIDAKPYIQPHRQLMWGPYWGTYLASDKPNMSCPSHNMCAQTNIWGDILTLMKVLKTVMSWM